MKTPYHYFLATRLRIRAIRRIWKIKNSGMVLDAGCGTGYLSELIARRNKASAGIDIDLESLRLAALNAKTVFFTQADLRHIPFHDTIFQAVVASEVLEHLPEECLALKEFYRVLRKNGELIITVPSSEGILSSSALRKTGHNSPGTEYHYRDGYSYRELSTILTKEGFKIQKHAYSTGLFSEVIIEFSKVVFLKKAKTSFSGQSQARKISGSKLFKIYAFLIFPILYLIGIIEEYTVCRLFKGHILIVRAQKNQ